MRVLICQQFYVTVLATLGDGNVSSPLHHNTTGRLIFKNKDQCSFDAVIYTLVADIAELTHANNSKVDTRQSHSKATKSRANTRSTTVRALDNMLLTTTAMAYFNAVTVVNKSLPVVSLFTTPGKITQHALKTDGVDVDDDDSYVYFKDVFEQEIIFNKNSTTDNGSDKSKNRNNRNNWNNSDIQNYNLFYIITYTGVIFAVVVIIGVLLYYIQLYRKLEYSKIDIMKYYYFFLLI